MDVVTFGETPVVETLLDAGFPIVEFTLTGDNALAAVEETAGIPGAMVDRSRSSQHRPGEWTITGPLPQVPLMPSGGLDIEDVGGYLGAGSVAVNVGRAVAPSPALESGDASEIPRRAERLRAAVSSAATPR